MPATLRREGSIAPGDQVAVVMTPEGQRADLPADLAAALETAPEAAAFFDSLASSTGGATCAGSTPLSAGRTCGRIRIAEVVGLCKAGIKSGPDKRRLSGSAVRVPTKSQQRARTYCSRKFSAHGGKPGSQKHPQLRA